MKTTLGRRWLSLLLTFVLCLSLSPTAWAADPGNLTLTPGDATLYAGSTTKNTTTVTIDKAAPDGTTVTWTSDTPAVASVADGTVTAVGAGTATITASYTDDAGTTYTGSCKITVVAKAVTKVEVTVTLDKNSLKPKETAKATATAKAVYNDGTEEDVSGGTWSSSNTNVAT